MIKRDLPYEGLLHEVVEHNGVLYIGGIVPEDTSLDMSGQAKDVLTQLTQLLKTLGSDPANVLQVTIYMTDLKDRRQSSTRSGKRTSQKLICRLAPQSAWPISVRASSSR